jgi:hypothetical protein
MEGWVALLTCIICGAQVEGEQTEQVSTADGSGATREEGLVDVWTHVARVAVERFEVQSIPRGGIDCMASRQFERGGTSERELLAVAIADLMETVHC